MSNFVCMLKQDMRRGMGWRMLLAVVLVALSILMDNADSVRYIGEDSNTTVYYFLVFSITIGGLFSIYLLPMLCAMPAATGFIEDRRHNFMPYMVARADKMNYLMSKYITSVMLGGLVAALGTALLIAVLSIGCPQIDASQFTADDMYMRGVTVNNMLPYYGYTLYYAFLNGCMYGGAAICVSAYINSVYFTLASPFVLSFLIVQGQRTLRVPDGYRLDMWLRMRTMVVSEGVTMLLSLACVAALLVLFGTVFVCKGRKAIENV